MEDKHGEHRKHDGQDLLLLTVEVSVFREIVVS